MAQLAFQAVFAIVVLVLPFARYAGGKVGFEATVINILFGISMILTYQWMESGGGESA